MDELTGAEYCRFCKSECLQIYENVTPPHYGEAYCPFCQRHSHWIKNPDKTNRRQSGVKLRKLIPNSLQNTCEICLRTKSELNNLNLSFEVHHVIPVDQQGSDEAENLRLVCSQCHELIHRHREIFKRYSKLLDSNENKLD